MFAVMAGALTAAIASENSYDNHHYSYTDYSEDHPKKADKPPHYPTRKELMQQFEECCKCEHRHDFWYHHDCCKNYEGLKTFEFEIKKCKKCLYHNEDKCINLVNTCQYRYAYFAYKDNVIYSPMYYKDYIFKELEARCNRRIYR